MLSASLMLIHLKERDAANRLLSAIESVYREKKNLTPDVGGAGTTDSFTGAVIEKLQATRL
jgi:isocitrate dehydrogenase (NAD+)